MTNENLLQNVKRIHFIGIGGSGMRPLAEILHTRGFSLSGSDNNESDNLKRMRELGIPVYMGHSAQNVQGADMVVYTVAVGLENPEIKEAEKQGIPLIERAQLLGWISRQYGQTVAVAGTHGKTTTTSMLSQVLLEADKDPSLFIGGRLPLINANGRSGKSDIMVCEACEFQDHYQAMAPAISILLNVDADHLDYFGSLENVIASFAKFVKKTTDFVIYNKADDNTKKAISALPEDKCISYGLTPDCDWYADNIRTENGAYGVYDLYHKGEFLTTVTLGVPGGHNVSNSLAVAAAATLCGVTPKEIAAGIAHFKGAGRRFEGIGEVNGITIIDDYAHHPTEIIASLSTAKKMNCERVWAIFQPFTFSRTARHLDEFAQALSLADQVVVSDIMGSREVNEWNVHSTGITNQIPGAHYLATFEEITRFVTANAKPGDLILTMGGGDVYKCARMIKNALEEMQ